MHHHQKPEQESFAAPPLRRAIAWPVLLGLMASLAQAVTTSRWTHTSEADFAAGQMQAVVATNLGDLKLSRSVKSILPQDARISAVHALAQTPDGIVYAATGPQGVLLKIENDIATEAATFGDAVSLFSLLVDRDGRLLVGTGGERGEVYRIGKDDSRTRIFSAEGVQYVWAMYQCDDGMIYIATGPTGQLHSVAPDGRSELVFDSDENNLLCLAGDGRDLLYAGTDPKGLVLRINRRTKQTFVVYDAAETEVSALVMTGGGELLAATAQGTPETETATPIASEQTGRPEESLGGVPLQAPPPESPKPPELPEPPPGEPRPIPKHLSILTDDDTAAAEPNATDVGEAAEAVALSPARAAAAIAPAVSGNAVYRIDRDGFVTELFRSNVMFFSLLSQNGEILAATGSEGLLYQLRPSAEETIVLAKVDPRQILCSLQARDGRVFLGCANRGDIAVMTRGFASTGEYISAVLDATQISRFGQLRLRGTLPERTSLYVSTRSGNVSDPAGTGWSEWTAAVSAAEFLPITAPPARFLQYRLSFASATGEQTPVVEEVEVAYQLPNLPPRVSAVRVLAGDATDADARPKRTISWDSADPNADTLQYKLEVRNLPSGDWIVIKRELSESYHEIDTRGFPDGRYQFRVTATDAAANHPGGGREGSRLSEPMTFDNTPPVIGDLSSEVTGDSVSVRMSVVDRTSTVMVVEYALDGADHWQSVLPADMIADSPKEAYEFAVPGLKPGPHQIALRATDSAGNRSFATVSTTVAAETD